MFVLGLGCSARRVALRLPESDSNRDHIKTFFNDRGDIRMSIMI